MDHHLNDPDERVVNVKYGVLKGRPLRFQLDWYPVRPGSVTIRVGPHATTVLGDRNGVLSGRSRDVSGTIDYKNGRVILEAVKGRRPGRVSIDYDFNSDPGLE